MRSPGTASQTTWKKRRAEYLLRCGRYAEIRAEGLETELGFKPGELEDHKDKAQIHMLRNKPKCKK